MFRLHVSLSAYFYSFLTFHDVTLYYVQVYFFQKRSVPPLGIQALCVVTLWGLVTAGSLKLRTEQGLAQSMLLK